MSNVGLHLFWEVGGKGERSKQNKEEKKSRDHELKLENLKRIVFTLLSQITDDALSYY